MADIEELADRIVAKGVKTITGDVIGDDSYLAWEPYPVGWGIDDLTPGYGAPVSALTIHDNELELDVAPAAASSFGGVMLMRGSCVVVRERQA